MSDRKGSKVSIVGTQGYAERTQVAQVDLWRLLVLPFFVQIGDSCPIAKVAKTAEKAHTVRSQVDLWRLLVLPFFVQLEIRVRSQSEYCMWRCSEGGMSVVKSLRLRKWICGGCWYYHPSCNGRFVSDRKVSKVSIAGTQGYAERIR